MNFTRHTAVCILISVSQLVLGIIYFVAPQEFVTWQGLTPVAADTAYPLAMLSARFLIYGFGMLLIARSPKRYGVWLDGMIAIQAIDLFAGAFLSAKGVIALSTAAMPMANAAVFIALMWWVRQPGDASHQAA